MLDFTKISTRKLVEMRSDYLDLANEFDREIAQKLIDSANAMTDELLRRGVGFAVVNES